MKRIESPLPPFDKGGKVFDFMKSSHVEAGLFFMDTGDYFFQWKGNKGLESKCVSSPDVAAAFSQSENDSGWLPKGIARHGFGPAGRWCVYTIEPAKVALDVSAPLGPATISASTPLPESGAVQASSATGEMEGNCKSVMLPNLVLLGIGRRYYLFAVAKPVDWFSKVTGRNIDGMNAYHAPFPNVHPDGMICFGANEVPLAEPENMPKVWELFIKSPFNADLVAGKSFRNMKDVRESLAAFGNKRTYPVNDMVSMKRSILRIVEEHIKENSVHVY